MNTNLKKKDIYLIVGILLLAALLYIIHQFGTDGKKGATLQIVVAGEVYGTYDLNVDQEISINDTNVCRIENGVVRMVASNCPDHLCEGQMPLDARGGSIVCLPNRVVLEIIPKDEEQNIDGISS